MRLLLLGLIFRIFVRAICDVAAWWFFFFAGSAALATAIGHDKSRLIPLLDQLEHDGLIVREQDPADRRHRRVRLTRQGESRLAAVQAEVRAMEDDLLADLSATDRRALLRILTHLADG